MEKYEENINNNAMEQNDPPDPKTVLKAEQKPLLRKLKDDDDDTFEVESSLARISDLKTRLYVRIEELLFKNYVQY